MKRIFTRVLTLILLLAVLALPANAASVTSLYINATVDLEAECTVTATVELYLEEAVEELRFSLPTGAKDGSVAGYRARERDGALVITRDGGFIGTNTFQISWTISATVVDNTDDTDDDENVLSVIVTIPLQSAGYSWTVEKATFQVAMPKTFDTTPEVISGYYGTLTAEDYLMEINGSVITGEIVSPLMDHEALSLRLILPVDYFTVDRTAGLNSGFGLWALAATALLCVAAEVYRRKKLRFRTLRIENRVQPPENVTAAAVPYLLDGENSDPAVLLTQWASLGYLTIINRGRARSTFHRRMAMGNERKEYEYTMFAAMFAGREVCQSTEKTFLRACMAMHKGLRRYWRSQIFDEKGGNPAIVRGLAALCAMAAAAASIYGLLPAGGAWIALSLLLGLSGLWLGVQIQQAASADRYRTGWTPVIRGAVCALVLVVLGILGKAWLAALAAAAVQIWFGYSVRHGGRRTQNGCELLEQLLGLRRFLLTASPKRLRALQEKQPQYYYDLLPYAEALGVGRQFSERFPAEQKLEPPDWLDTGVRQAMAPREFYTVYHTLIQALRTGESVTARANTAKKRRTKVGSNRTDRRR